MSLQQYGQDSAQSGGRGSPNAISPASDGQNWGQLTGTATPSIVSASGLNRIQLTNDTTTNIFTLGSNQYTDVDQYVRVNVSAAEVTVGLVARCTASNTYYRADISNGGLEIILNNGGTKTTLASSTPTFSSATYYWLHFRVRGFGQAGSNPNNLQVNFWADPNSGSGSTPTGEPTGWMLQAADGTLDQRGQFGLFFQPVHLAETATYDYYTCTDNPAPDTFPAYKTTGNEPYGVTYYIANTPPAFPNQLVADLAGPNSVSSTGWGNGCNVRYQLQWKVIEQTQGVYDWGNLDAAVQICNYNGIRFFLQLANPPSFYQTLDAMGSNATLNASYSTSSHYTSLTVTALRKGAYLPHGYQITVNSGGGTAENLYIWNPGATYTAGATSIGISTSSASQVAWTPANNHSPGEPVAEKNGGASQFVKSGDFKNFATIVATRYNGLSGYGKIDAFQVENEDYDLSNRVQNQGSYNSGSNSPSSWDMSSTYDNGGAILAPVYNAVNNAIAAVPGHASTPVFACAVRKTSNTGRQHIQNWMNGFVSQVLALGGTIDGIDFHYYRSGTTDWDGTLSQDPTVPTYTDSSRTVINAPDIATELADLQTILGASSLTGTLIMCGETGWDIYDDAGGAKTTTTANRNSGTAYTTLAVSGTWTKATAIPDATPIYVDYTNTGVTELVYAYGATAANSTSIPITTNPAGSAASQVSWTPAHNHSSGITVYGANSINPVSPATQSAYIQAMYDAMRKAGANYCFIFTDNPPQSTVNSAHTPASSANTKGITQTISSVYTYEPAYGMTATYSVTYPTWYVTTGGGGSSSGSGGGTGSGSGSGSSGSGSSSSSIAATGAPVVMIDGVIYMVDAGSLTFDQNVGKTSTAAFTVHTQNYQTQTTTTTYTPRIFGGPVPLSETVTTTPYAYAPGTHFQQYQQTNIYDKTGSLVFSGYLAAPIKETKPGFQDSLEHTLTAVDQHWLAHKRIVAASYVNKTCGYIAQDILNNILSQEGVTRGAIFDGLTPSTTLYPSVNLYPGGNVGLIPSAVFAYCTVSDALDALVQQASEAGTPYYWLIDQNKKFWFVPYATIINPTILDGTSIDEGERSGQAPYVQRQNPTYRNSQYILGGVSETTTQTETRKGDSNTRSWTMGYDLAQSPTITVNGGAAQTVGLKGSTGSQWYWNQGDPIITQDTGQTVLTSSDTLQVVYIGQYPTVINVPSGAQISYQASLDGTSGIVEEVETDPTVISQNDGIAKATALLNRYGVQGTIFVGNTLVSTYTPGQLVTVNLPWHGLYNTPMLIADVSASDQQDGFNLWYAITAVAGPYDGSAWEFFWKKLIKKTNVASTINVGVSQTLTLVEDVVISTAPTLSLNITLTGTPVPSTSLFPSVTLYP